MAEGDKKVVCVTGAAGQIGYSLLPMIAGGRMFGGKVRVHLKMLDIEPMMKTLEGVAFELEDCAYPLLEKVEFGFDPKEMFADCDVIVCLGGFPRKEGMERKELLERNANIFKEQGSAANEVCKATTKFLIVANPANTNCLIMSHYAPNLPKKNFTCLTRLDMNRAKAQIAEKVGGRPESVKNITIWGNHSATQYPDVNHGYVDGVRIRAKVEDNVWLNGEFITTVQKRGAAVIALRKFSSAMSAANAAIDHVRDWYYGSNEGEWVSMGIINEGGMYGIDSGLCYSMPVKTNNFEWKVVEGLEIDAFSREKMDITQKELQGEKAEALK